LSLTEDAALFFIEGQLWILQRLDGFARDLLERYEYVNGRTGYRNIVSISGVHNAVVISQGIS
jgi:hypothetical protein